MFSGGLNAAAASFTVDVLQNACGVDLSSPRRLVRVSRITTLVLGVAMVILAVGATKLEQAIAPMSVFFLGLCGGLVLGLFLLGMLWARANWQGASLASAAGLLVSVLLCWAQFGGPAAWRVNIWGTTVVVSTSTFLVGVASSELWPPPPSKATAGTLFVRGGRKAARSVPLLGG